MIYRFERKGLDPIDVDVVGWPNALDAFEAKGGVCDEVSQVWLELNLPGMLEDRYL